MEITLTIWFRGKTDEQVTFVFDGTATYDEFKKQLQDGITKTNSKTIDIVDLEIEDNLSDEQEIEHGVLMDFVDALNDKSKWEDVYKIFNYLVLDDYEYPIEVLNLFDYIGMDIDEMVEILEGNGNVSLYCADNPIENNEDLGIEYFYDVYGNFDNLVKQCQKNDSLQSYMQYYLDGKCLAKQYNLDLEEDEEEINDIFDIYSENEIWSEFSPIYLEDCFDYESYGTDLSNDITYLPGGHYYVSG